MENGESSDETKLNERRAIMQTRVISWWKSGKVEMGNQVGEMSFSPALFAFLLQSVCFIAGVFMPLFSGWETMPEVGEKAAAGCQHKCVFYACRKRWQNGKKTPRKKRKYFLPFFPQPEL